MRATFCWSHIFILWDLIFNIWVYKRGLDGRPERHPGTGKRTCFCRCVAPIRAIHPPRHVRGPNSTLYAPVQYCLLIGIHSCPQYLIANMNRIKQSVESISPLPSDAPKLRKPTISGKWNLTMLSDEERKAAENAGRRAEVNRLVEQKKRHYKKRHLPRAATAERPLSPDLEIPRATSPLHSAFSEAQNAWVDRYGSGPVLLGLKTSGTASRTTTHQRVEPGVDGLKTQYEINREMLLDLMHTAENINSDSVAARKEAKEREVPLGLNPS